MIQKSVGTHLGDQRIDRKWSRDKPYPCTSESKTPTHKGSN